MLGNILGSNEPLLTHKWAIVLNDQFKFLDDNGDHAAVEIFYKN
jgi:hypothetical protein